MNRAEASTRLKAALAKYASSSDPAEFDLLPKELTAGKLYEAYVLALVARDLVQQEGLRLTLINGNYLPLKSSPSGINRLYPHIRVSKVGALVAEIWTDIEFLSMSHAKRGSPTPSRGEYHELDIVMVRSALSGRPRHDQILMGIECKNTGYEKGMLKQILGIRRELSLLSEERRTFFNKWPRDRVPAAPPSCLLVYSTDPRVSDYAQPGVTFGIDFCHEDLLP